MSEIAVVHLVRRKNGVAPLERFLESYSRHPAGQPHELVLVFKGFSGRRSFAGYEGTLSTIGHRRILVPDLGRDMRTYFLAVQRLDCRYICFLNSYSRILASDWLGKLYRWISMDGVGLVGATGSSQSIAGGLANRQEYMRALPFLDGLKARADYARSVLRRGLFLKHSGYLLLYALGVWRPARDFPVFPNYHVRTNAFMATRGTLACIDRGLLVTRFSGYKLESGVDSITNQVRRSGMRVMVVGRDGEGYEPERWHLSNTFWQSRQENLLVADNQTESYTAADQARRAQLARYAWGGLARAT